MDLVFFVVVNDFGHIVRGKGKATKLKNHHENLHYAFTEYQGSNETSRLKFFCNKK